MPEEDRRVVFANILRLPKPQFSLFRELPGQIELHNETVREKLKEQLHSMDPRAFEELIRDLLYSLGFQDAQVTESNNDRGIDVRGTLVVGEAIRIRMAVQVKRWRHNVQTPIVQQLRGSLATDEQALIITTSDFSAGARTEAARRTATTPPIGLLNGEQLVKLLTQYDMGVHRRTYELIELNSEVEFLLSCEEKDI